MAKTKSSRPDRQVAWEVVRVEALHSAPSTKGGEVRLTLSGAAPDAVAAACEAAQAARELAEWRFAVRVSDEADPAPAKG